MDNFRRIRTPSQACTERLNAALLAMGLHPVVGANGELDVEFDSELLPKIHEVVSASSGLYVSKTR